MSKAMPINSENLGRVGDPGRSTRSRAGSYSMAVISGVVLSPLFLLGVAKNAASDRAKQWLLTLFFTIYGSTIAIAYDPLGLGPDGVRHLLGVYVHYVGLGFDEFLTQLRQILLFQNSAAPSTDVYKHVLSYFVGGVLEMPWLFFPIVATIYGYFFSGSLLIVFAGWGKARLPIVTLFLIATFFLIKNIEGVNTVRTWTGLWVLVYACLRYYQTRKFRYLLLMATPPFIHVGYFIMALPAYIVLVFGSRTVLFSVLFAASSFTTFFNPGQVTEVISETQLGAVKVNAYYTDISRDQRLKAHRSEGRRVWLQLFSWGVQKWALLAFVYTVLFSGVYSRKMNDFQKKIFSIGLLTLTLSNSSWYLYAVSERTWIIAAIFLFSAFTMWQIQISQTRKKRPDGILYQMGMAISAVLFVPYFVYNLSTLIDFPSIFLFGFPMAVWADPSVNMSVKELLRILLIEILEII